MAFQWKIHNISHDLNFTEAQVLAVLFSMGTGGVIGVLVCLISLGLVIVFKLYRYFVHRLAVYQVLGALLFSVACVLELLTTPVEYKEFLCVLMGFFLQYTQWLKLVFTFCLTFHLFCFTVFYINLDNFENFYIFLAIILPLLLNWVPFIHEVYGPAGVWCWIQNWKNNIPGEDREEGVIEEYTLLYGPALFGLSISAITVTVVIVVLVCRAKCNNQSAGIEEEPLLQIKKQRQQKVLREVLPLIVYPILSITFYVPAFVNRLIGSLNKKANFISFMWSAVSLPFLGIFAGLALIVHIVVLRKKSVQSRNQTRHCTKSIARPDLVKDEFCTETVASTNAQTLWSAVPESIVDDYLMIK